MKYLTLILATLLSSALMACSAQNNETSVETHEKHSSEKSTHITQASSKTGAHALIKTHVSKERVAVGETVTVKIQFNNTQQAVEAKVDTTSDLTLNGEKQFNIAQSKTGANSEVSFEVTPLSEGIHIINVFAKTTSLSHEKPSAIRIIAGDKPIEEYLQTNGQLAEDENGEKIIIMQAEER